MKKYSEYIKEFPQNLNSLAKEIQRQYIGITNTKTIINNRKIYIALRIKQLRQEAHLTHEQIGEKAHINKVTYSGYENGHNSIPIEALIRIADAYDVSMDYITCRSDNKKGKYATDEETDIKKRLEALEQAIKSK